MFLFQLISLLLISITFYMYLSNIVFSCNLAFKFSLSQFHNASVSTGVHDVNYDTWPSPL